MGVEKEGKKKKEKREKKGEKSPERMRNSCAVSLTRAKFDCSRSKRKTERIICAAFESSSIRADSLSLSFSFPNRLWMGEIRRFYPNVSVIAIN